jgi:acyl-CoA synthetase (AMP-forming)/AMP-acid ligase II
VFARTRLAFDRDLTLGVVAGRLAAIHGRRTMVDEEGWVVSFREAADLVERWSAAVEAQVEPGARVVLAVPNGYRQLLATLAVSRAGGVAVPVNAQMRPVEIEHVVDDAGATLVVRDTSELDRRPPGARGALAPPPAVPGPDDLAALFYTSGTTGRPKGVQLSHRALIGASRLGALNVLPAASAVMALPIAHIMGFTAGLGFALAGVPVAALRRFDAEAVLDLIEGRRARIFIGVPAMYRLLLEAGAEERDLRSVRLWLSGADVMPPELAERFQAMGSSMDLPGVGPVGRAAFVEGYGLAESAGAVAMKAHLPVRLPALPGRPGARQGGSDTVGVPLPGVRFRIRDGELEVRAPGVTSGYWGDAAASAAALTDDGWLRTGDRAAPGLFGTVRFQGRSKDVIKVGGYSVYAVEVEAALATHPAIAEAAVLALPDERLGEIPGAVVRLASGSGTAGAAPDPDQLLTEAAADLASYKRPRRLVIVDEFPRTGSGKVQKDRLRPLFTTGGAWS